MTFPRLTSPHLLVNSSSWACLFDCGTQLFQKFIDQLLRGLPFIYAYIDDFLVTSATPEEHSHLQQLFQGLQEHVIGISPEKCIFGVSSIEFLGHHVDSEGVCPLESKVKAIQELPAPSSL